MAKKKPAVAVGTPTPGFPLLRYASRLSVHLPLLVFSALYLPRSTTFFTDLPAPKSSLDRPEPLFIQPLTASPLLTTAWLCIGAALIVVPRAHAVRAWTFAERTDMNNEQRVAWSSGGGTAALHALLAVLGATGVVHVVLVLFGAPILADAPHTLLLALLISLLVVAVPVHALGVPSMQSRLGSRWVRIFCEFSPRTEAERVLFYPSAATILGAWIGSFPIPLDWDRPWQAWPLTPAYGAIAGYIVGSLAALYINVTIHMARPDLQNQAASKRSE